MESPPGGGLGLDLDAILDSEVLRVFGDGVEAVGRAVECIRRFLSYIGERVDSIGSRLSQVKAVPLDSGAGAVVLDPTGRLFSTVVVERLGRRVYMARMEPPYIPHFLLFIAYLCHRAGLTPSTLVRTEPVYSLVSLLVRGDVLAAATLQVYTATAAIRGFIEGELTVLPFPVEALELPVSSSKLYLTPLGFSTRPLETLDFNIEVDLESVPGLDGGVHSKLEFTSLRSVVEEVARVIQG